MAVNRSRSFVFTLFQDIFLLLAILSACAVRYAIEPFSLYTGQKIGAALVVFVVYKLSFHYFNIYQINLHISLREFVTQLLIVNIVALIFLTILFYIYPPLIIGRGILSLNVVFTMLFTTAHRLLWGALSKEVAFTKNLLILGAGASARVVLSEVTNYRHSGYRILGLLTADPDRVGEEVGEGIRILGVVDDLSKIGKEMDVDEIVVALQEARGNLPFKDLLEFKIRGVQIIDSTQFHERFTGKIILEGLRSSWFIFSEGFVVGRFAQLIKRVSDLLTALVLTILTAPLCLLVSLIIKLTSKGPILFRQERVGLGGKTFMLIKFRSMKVDSEKEGPVWAQANDPRVTLVGRFVRRFRIDEIPQIWNVVKGEMSFVGPRPERPYFVSKLSDSLPFYPQRHILKPGITGWAQVRFPYGATMEDAKEKLQRDLYYIKNISLGFDAKILVETIGVVLGKMKAH